MIIAIDGPAASGKSVTAKKVAEELGFMHLNTGSMYRALTLHFIELDVDIKNEEDILEALDSFEIRFDSGDPNKIFLSDKDVSLSIRSSHIDLKVSKISAVKMVREKLVDHQRQIANNNNIVIEGRDIGTYVFPKAEYKFFLTADIKVRAKRRYEDISTISNNLDQILNDLKKRDEYDKNRKHSPLTKADDAIVIDTSQIDIKEQVKRIINIINNKER